jgi:hypothetical protein
MFAVLDANRSGPILAVFFGGGGWWEVGVVGWIEYG